MKFDATAKVYSIVFSKLLKDYYQRHYPEIDIKPIVKDVKKEYKEMVERTPGIKESGSGMESNLVGACYFFAMAKKIDNLTPKVLDNMVVESMKSDLMVKMHKGKKEKGVLFSDKSQNLKAEQAKLSEKSDLEMDWKYTFNKGKNEFSYNMTKCGVCELAKRENLMEYLPCMCKMDYPKFEIIGAKLIRTKTLANGDDCCNFHLVKMGSDKDVMLPPDTKLI